MLKYSVARTAQGRNPTSCNYVVTFLLFKTVQGTSAGPDWKPLGNAVNMIAFIPMGRPTGRCFGSKSKPGKRRLYVSGEATKATLEQVGKLSSVTLAPKIAAALFTKAATATQDCEKSTGNRMFWTVMGSLRTLNSITSIDF
jgi:hypothetical protein